MWVNDTPLTRDNVKEGLCFVDTRKEKSRWYWIILEVEMDGFTYQGYNTKTGEKSDFGAGTYKFRRLSEENGTLFECRPDNQPITKDAVKTYF